MTPFKVICTIGPGSINDKILLGLKLRNVDFFRINLSHTPQSSLEKLIKTLIRHNVEIIIDTEGPQIRTGLESEILLEDGGRLNIFNREVKCTKDKLFFRPVDCIEYINIGDLIRLDFNSAMVRVSDISELKSEGYISTKVVIGGLVGSRKGVFVDRELDLPIYSSKDYFAINLAKKYGIKYFTLSFVTSKKDVEKFKEVYPDSFCYSKIEKLKALINLDEILDVSEGILIDRGDLSREVPLEKIPFVQKYILNKAKNASKEAFVATNTLEKMSFSLKPDKSEVNDIINTILDGATGIALTKETAIGNYPLETLNMLNLLNEQIAYLGLDYDSNISVIEKSMIKHRYIEKHDAPSLLVKPHGGNLINRFFEGDVSKISGTFKRIFIDKRTLMDINHLANGVFSPLEGFLDEDNFESVLNEMRLVNGTVWSIPIILQVDEKTIEKIKNEDKIILSYIGNNEDYAILSIEDIYEINKSKMLVKWFGTDNPKHPGVSYIANRGNYAIGGKILSLNNASNITDNIFELDPQQMRLIFSERGWSRVVGFHTRNMIHRGHEYLQLDALYKEGCDGLLIHPVIGDRKRGDFVSDLIIDSYHYMLHNVYPKGKVVFSPFFSYSRFAGPREAVFTAIIRKNFGCSHFIVGRDHTGVANYYGSKDSQDIFKSFSDEELGIRIVKYDEIYFSPSKNQYLVGVPDQLSESPDRIRISGSEVRKMIKEGLNVPKWLMRPEVTELINKRIKQGKEIFLE